MIFSYLILVVSLVSCIHTVHPMEPGQTPNGDEPTTQSMGFFATIRQLSNKVVNSFTSPSIPKEQICQEIETALKNNQPDHAMELIMKNCSMLEVHESQAYGYRLLQSLTEVELTSNNGALTSIFGNTNQYWEKDDLKYFLLQALLQLKTQENEVVNLKAQLIASNALVQELMTKQEFTVVEKQSIDPQESQSSLSQNDPQARLLKSFVVNYNYSPF